MTPVLLASKQSSKFICNHDIMHCTAEGVDGNYLYSGRALGITSAHDKIQLHEKLKPLWLDITAHYKRVGLAHSEDVIWFLDLKQLGSHIGYHPSVFFFGPNEYENWGDYRWYESVARINSKNNFMRIAKELGVDIPDTLCFESVSEINNGVIDAVNYPCYLKAAVSVAGIGIYRCTTPGELRTNLLKFRGNTPLQIQEEIQSTIFLNLQYQVIKDKLVRLAATEQILDGFVHQGNRYPARFSPWENVDKLALWLKDQGMKGIFAFDLAVVECGTGRRFPAIECNPRFNGATYPTIIANKLGIQEWSSYTFQSKYRSLKDIDLNGIEYDPVSGNGVVLVNWGTILVGKIVALLAGSYEQQEKLRLDLEQRLC